MAKNGYRFDLRTQTGVEFNSLTMAQLQSLANDGTLQPEDLVQVVGDPRQQWFAARVVEGLVFPSSTGQAWEDDSLSQSESGGMPLAMVGGLIVMFIAVLAGGAVLAFMLWPMNASVGALEERTRETNSGLPVVVGDSAWAVEKFESSLRLATQKLDEGEFDSAEQITRIATVRLASQRGFLRPRDYSERIRQANELLERISDAAKQAGVAVTTEADSQLPEIVSGTDGAEEVSPTKPTETTEEQPVAGTTYAQRRYFCAL